MGREALDAAAGIVATRAALAAAAIAVIVFLPAFLAALLDQLGRASRTASALRRMCPPVVQRLAAVAISVCDNGDGIAADQLEAIFDRFRRADPSRAAVDGSGSGLGLTIARAIVRAHGGTLRATSEGVGHGATFMVRLPAPTSR